MRSTETKLAVFLVAASLGGCSGSAERLSPNTVANTTARPPEARFTVESYGGFNGRWEGTFARVPNPIFDRTPNSSVTTNIAFSIADSDVKVYLKSNGGWTEAKRGTYRFTQLATNAVIASITTNADRDPDGWVETWNFTITHKDRDSLDVFFTRAVRNFARAHDFKSDDGNYSGRFFHIAYGEMHRTSQIP